MCKRRVCIANSIGAEEMHSVGIVLIVEKDHILLDLRWYNGDLGGVQSFFPIGIKLSESLKVIFHIVNNLDLTYIY